MGRKKSTVKDIDRGWKDIGRNYAAFSRSDVFVGLNEGNTGVRQDQEGSSTITMAGIGAVHEFGTDDGTIPPRPWLRSAVDANRKETGDRYESILRKILDNRVDLTRELNRLGLWGVKIVRRYIRDTGPGVWLPLSPATIEAKGSSKPLVDTGQMVQSITYIVREGRKIIGKSRPGSRG
jgi:hypothetical protein